jgi:uncharacterized protein YidB (DUF937 family)
MPTNALLRSIYGRVAEASPPGVTRVPLRDFLSTATQIASSTSGHPLAPSRPGDTVATATLDAAYNTKRGVYINEVDNTVSLDPNTMVKHARMFLRAVARVPAAGMPKATFRQWLSKLSDDEFNAGLMRVFDAWIAVTPNGTVVPKRHGSTALVQATLQALMAAPDTGISQGELARAVANATDAAVTSSQLGAALEELWSWHAPLGSATAAPPSPLQQQQQRQNSAAKSEEETRYCFCDWHSVMRKVQQRLPTEGVLLPTFLRFVTTEGAWSTASPPNIGALITDEWLQTRFSDLFFVRTAFTDGCSAIVTPRLGVDTPGHASTALRVLLAAPGEANVTLPFNVGWRPASDAISALDDALPAPETIGMDSWREFMQAHPAFEHEVLVSIRPKPDRSRAIVFVDVSGSDFTPGIVDSMLRKAGLCDGDRTVEWARIALRGATQEAHGATDVVSPLWLETEFVLAAQLAKLAERMDGTSVVDADHIIIVCDDKAADTLAAIAVSAASAAFKHLSIVTPSEVRKIR